MIGIEITQPGGPEVLQPRELADPQPRAGEVLIAVAAAGVNRPDLLQRRGLYPPPPGASPLPGLEVAGTVLAVAAGVTRPVAGDQVCALVASGGYAERCLAPAGSVLPVPRGLPLEHAAGLPETVFTVWVNVFERAGLQPGESLLVHGGASGIGTTAIQLAKALGSTVYCTAGTPEKCRRCEELGADRAIYYRREDFVEVVSKLTRRRGVDVILDMVGGPYMSRNLEALADDGRLSMIAFLGGHRAEMDFAPLLRRRLTITGSTLRARAADFKARVARAVEERVWPLVESGGLRPVIDSTFPLRDAALAHARLEQNLNVGKVLLLADRAASRPGGGTK